MAQAGKNFPLDNLTYDLITVIHEKSEALEAYDKYLQDAQGNDRVRQSFEKMRKQDRECINELTQHLSFLIGQQNQADGGMSGQGQQSSSSRTATSGGGSSTERR